MTHLRIVIGIVLLLASILAVMLLVFMFSSGPNGGYMSMRAESIEDLKNALGCSFDEAIGTSQGKTSLDKTHGLKEGGKGFQ